MQTEKVRDDQLGLSEVNGVLCVSWVSCVSVLVEWKPITEGGAS